MLIVIWEATKFKYSNRILYIVKKFKLNGTE